MTASATTVPENPAAPSVSDARLASVLDTAVDGIIVIDARGHILVFNAACERLFGIKAAEAIGQNVSIIMPPEDAGGHDQYVSSYVRSGERKVIGIGREVMGRHADGTVFPLELSVGDASTPDGRQFIGILRDRRPHIEAQERLASLQAEVVRMTRVSALDEMGAAIAHEINQPLTAIMLYLQAARQSAGADPQAQAQSLDKAAREAERASAIIRRMRAFAEKREPERRDIDLSVVAAEALDLTLMGRRAVARIERKFYEGLPIVSADPVQIQQIVVNLVRNALDAVAGVPDPVVRLQTARDGDHVALLVADNGPGIAPDIVPNLFHAFASGKPNGLGLGLAIARSIAQNHGGDLVVDPGGNGEGARFELRLPVAP